MPDQVTARVERMVHLDSRDDYEPHNAYAVRYGHDGLVAFTVGVDGSAPECAAAAHLLAREMSAPA